MAAAQGWQDAFEAVRRERHFLPLNELLGVGVKPPPTSAAPGINETLCWDGAFLTPLFVAVLLRLDDHVPQLLARGADINVQCLFEGLLCCPLHAAALRGDCAVISALLDSGCDANISGAETSLLDGPDGTDPGAGGRTFVHCNALHVLVARDIFSEQVYSLLLSRGAKLSSVCTTGSGSEISGLSMPRELGNKEATEERIDTVLHEELLHTIRTPGLANELNALFELGSTLKRERPDTAYRFVRSLDFQFQSGQSGELTTLLLYAADVGNCEALRLLLYGGAEPTVMVQRSVPFSAGHTLMLSASVLHIAALKADLPMIEQLLFFGIDPFAPACEGVLRQGDQEPAEGDGEERWQRLGLLHLAVLAGRDQELPGIAKLGCDVDKQAERIVPDKTPELVSPLHLAALIDHVDCAAKLIDLGAAADARTKATAMERRNVCEMFGGPPVVGLDDWLEALLTGEESLRRLIARRTDLSRALEFPELEAPDASSAFAERLERFRFANPELTERLAKSLEEAPTVLRALRPVHLACLLQQPWAIEIMASAGAVVSDATPPCFDMPRDEIPLPGPEDHPLSRLAFDLVFFCVRTGSMQALELLVKDPRFALDVRSEIPLAPDIMPTFYPRRHPAGDDRALTWAWCRLGAMELALLHRRVDVAVLLCRLGVDLLHTVDHISVRPPQHYSVTDHCFRGLTPLHLCALLDFRVAASSLLHEACDDTSPVLPGEHPRPQRQALLSASNCMQCWATVDTAGDTSKEPWLWRDLTPLHLAIIAGSTDTAELLVDAAGPSALDRVCYNMDAAGDVERSFSTLLLAFERGYKDLHRRIARKFPSC